MCDYHVFREGIKPMWEDDANRDGGKWIVRVKKGVAARYWEGVILAIVGGQFNVGDEICGAVLSVRYNEDIISLWNKSAESRKLCMQIRETLRTVMGLPADAVMEYKKHVESMRDNSSYRNTNAFDEKEGGGGGGGGAETCDEGSSAPGTLRFDESTGLFAVEASPEEPEPVSPATEREKARDAARDAARSARRRIDEEAEASGSGSGQSDPGSSDEGGEALSPRSPLQSPLDAGAKPDNAPAAVFVDLSPLEARYTEPPAHMRKSLA